MQGCPVNPCGVCGGCPSLPLSRSLDHCPLCLPLSLLSPVLPRSLLPLCTDGRGPARRHPDNLPPTRRTSWPGQHHPPCQVPHSGDGAAQTQGIMGRGGSVGGWDLRTFRLPPGGRGSELGRKSAPGWQVLPQPGLCPPTCAHSPRGPWLHLRQAHLFPFRGHRVLQSGRLVHCSAHIT